MNRFSARRVLWVLGTGILAAATFLVISKISQAATNISATTTEHWAWNDVIGWINLYSTNNIIVASTTISGYASSSVGDISLDCNTTRNGNICATSPYRVYNDGLGNLAGFGWNDVYGWISFCGGQGTSDCPDSAYGNFDYQVMIDPDTGIFKGDTFNYAWNDIVGWISFNCANGGNDIGGNVISVCDTSDYKVVTSWRAAAATGTLDSVTFDTRAAEGAQVNSVAWRGSKPAGTLVGFQFASSNCANGATNPPACTVGAGAWDFVGPDGTANSYYGLGAFVVPGDSIPVDYVLHNNYRYFRYRVTLFSDRAQIVGPRVDDIIVNWSP